MIYDYQDAEGYARGDMGKGKPKATRIYKLQRITNGMAFLMASTVWGQTVYDVLPASTVCPLPEKITR